MMSFWEQITAPQVGRYVAIAGLFVNLWFSRRTERRDIERRHAENLEEIRKNTREASEIATKVNMIWRWFERNVVGKDEPYRRHGRQEGGAD